MIESRHKVPFEPGNKALTAKYMVPSFIIILLILLSPASRALYYITIPIFFICLQFFWLGFKMLVWRHLNNPTRFFNCVFWVIVIIFILVIWYVDKNDLYYSIESYLSG